MIHRARPVLPQMSARNRDAEQPGVLFEMLKITRTLIDSLNDQLLLSPALTDIFRD